MTTPKEIYDTKRENFLRKTKLYFDFLITEFEFKKPNYTYYAQENGSVISDKFEFVNPDKNLSITIFNKYHPVDYGFEINLTNLNTGKEEMLHLVLKENQDVEQNYLEKASDFLKTEYEQRLHSKH